MGSWVILQPDLSSSASFAYTSWKLCLQSSTAMPRVWAADPSSLCQHNIHRPCAHAAHEVEMDVAGEVGKSRVNEPVL